MAAGARPPIDRIPLKSADALLSATSALMRERNSVEVTFSDISERSGLNSALVRYHFGSKIGLFKALLERDAGGTALELEKLVAADMTAEQKLRHHIHGVVKSYFRHPYLNRLIDLLLNEGDEETSRFIIERIVEPVAAAQRAILVQGEREGAFRAVDPTLFYFTLVGACDQIFHARQSLNRAFGIEAVDDEMRRQHADHVCAILLNGVLRPG